MLLEQDKLIFTEDDLLNLVPYYARQIGNNAADYDISVTLNTYTHIGYDDAKEELKQVVNGE